jgi:hypothetical protein
VVAKRSETCRLLAKATHRPTTFAHDPPPSPGGFRQAGIFSELGMAHARKGFSNV